jgi:hypothetical protein
MTMSTAIMTIYTLQRFHNFTHMMVISSLAKRLEVSILPNVLSYTVFKPKPSTNRMHDPGSFVPHKRPKVLTDNQMS